MGNLLFEGRKWLSSPDKWPQQPEVAATSETARESVKPKLEKLLFAKEEEQNETTEPLLCNYASYWKLLRGTAFVKRFIDNCRKSEKEKGQLRTKEFDAAERFWITQVQTSQPLESHVGLKKDKEGIFRCAGRVQRYNPVFLPHKLAALIVHMSRSCMGKSPKPCVACKRSFGYRNCDHALTNRAVHNCGNCRPYCKKPLTISCNSDSMLSDSMY